MSKDKNKALIIPLDMRRRPLGGPAGHWEHCNPTPDGPEKPFAHYQANRLRRLLGR